ncbi:MAG TPA: roadblock/LC7 domain-containing protein [Kouleothrix sp.]|uniref:roadblock/LC7 domain-containing protein n=1 Tax=Kouleothrix sp. TaxID=2779161 RepID=UPI002B7DF549|nr:roadblock/LC7 domain-containing protein [Kouleothrix sp.]
MATRLEQIMAVLDRLSSNAGSDVTGTVAVSTDGIVLAARVSSEINADRMGATAATLIGVSKRVSNDLKIGQAEESIIRADNGLLMVLPAGEQALLAVNMRQGAALGIVMIEARDAAAAIGRAL